MAHPQIALIDEQSSRFGLILPEREPSCCYDLLNRQITLVAATDSVTLTWPAAPGRIYRVRYKDDLNDPAWQDAPGAISVIKKALGYEGSYGAAGLQAKRFYWISVAE